MMEWYLIISYFFTNSIQILMCLFLITAILKFPRIKSPAIFLSFIMSLIVTIFSLMTHSQIYSIGVEIIILLGIIHFLYHEKLRLPFFLIFFYKISVELWIFLISTLLAIIFHSNSFTEKTALEYLAAIWIVHLLLIGIVVLIIKIRKAGKNLSFRFTAILMFIGMLGVIILAGQPELPVSEDQISKWSILSPLTLMSVLFFNMNRQYETEKQLAESKTEQAAILEQDYQTLQKIYSSNSKLFHDLNNHMEAMYSYLLHDQTEKAIKYLENLRAPINEISQTIWTGDDAVDYLINSKIALAKKDKNIVKVNIEFPHHTNIRSTDLVIILGNLLDNAIEASHDAELDLKQISLTIRRINDILIIKVENGCAVAPSILNGAIETTKSDKLLHGWGLKSASTAVMHYDGTIETSYDNNKFCVVATLFF